MTRTAGNCAGSSRRSGSAGPDTARRLTGHKRLAVRAIPQTEIDPHVFLSLLLAIADHWENGGERTASIDAFDAAIEDRLTPDQLPRADDQEGR